MRRTVAVGALAARALAGCGRDKTPVAHVGDAAIPKSDFDSEFSRGARFTLKPPDFSECVDRVKLGGAATPAMKSYCRYQYVRQVNSAMSTVIHFEWVRQEA